MLTQLPKSPITQNGDVKIFDTIPVKDVIRLYQQQESINVERFFTGFDTLYILECQDTGYRFYYPFETIGDEEFYQGLRHSEYDREEAADHLFAKTQIERNSKLLEIGCGSGKFLQSISEITPDVCGLELNSLIAEKAKAKGLDVKSQLIEDFALENTESFDVVCAFQVLEHINTVNSFLESALKLLKPKGKLIFSVPNNEPYFQRFSKYEVLNLPPHHMGLWNLESFEKLAKHFNLNLDKHHFTGKSSFRADVYLRAKSWANVKSLPHQHSFTEKLKIFSVAPISSIVTSFEQFRRKFGYGHISVVFSKK
jgi:2-polyprenyl-3-methyl-5-hydroxy-6-metoxy-1,4-benzoquinol methylase